MAPFERHAALVAEERARDLDPEHELAFAQESQTWFRKPERRTS